MADIFDQIHAEKKPEPSSGGGDIFDQIHAGGRSFTGRNGTVHQAIPENTEVLGAPVFPSGAIIPSAVGYGTSKLGEHLGLPDWASTAAGLVTGGLTGAGTALASKFRTLPPDKAAGLTKAVVGSIPIVGKWANAAREAFSTEPTVPQPFRPNPAIASKMRFGGPVDTAGGSSYPGVGMSGAPVIENEPQIWKPNKPNPSIAAKIKYGGPSDTAGGPAYSRVGMSGAPPAPEVSEGIAPTPSYTGPNRVNPNIARNLRFTPGNNPNAGGGSASRIAGRGGIAAQKSAPIAAQVPSAPAPSIAADDDLVPLLQKSIENARSSGKTPIRENIRRR